MDIEKLAELRGDLVAKGLVEPGEHLEDLDILVTWVRHEVGTTRSMGLLLADQDADDERSLLARLVVRRLERVLDQLGPHVVQLPDPADTAPA